MFVLVFFFFGVGHLPFMGGNDLGICMYVCNLNTLLHKANLDLDKFYQWCLSNRLTVNTEKTKYMIVSNKKTDTLPPLFLHFDPISRTSHHKLLGITIDDTLSFKYHIQNLCSKLSYSIALIYQVKDRKPSKYQQVT